MRITGDGVGAVSNWTAGQKMDFSVQGLPDDAVVTVAAYSSNNQKVTDLLSSVGGLFQIENGIGTYTGASGGTGKLVLSSAAKARTYRLVFEVTANGQSVLTVPYYVVVC